MTYLRQYLTNKRYIKFKCFVLHFVLHNMPFIYISMLDIECVFATLNKSKPVFMRASVKLAFLIFTFVRFKSHHQHAIAVSERYRYF